MVSAVSIEQDIGSLKLISKLFANYSSPDPVRAFGCISKYIFTRNIVNYMQILYFVPIKEGNFFFFLFKVNSIYVEMLSSNGGVREHVESILLKMLMLFSKRSLSRN